MQLAVCTNHFGSAKILFALAIPGAVLWPYVAALAVLALGLVSAAQPVRQARGFTKLVLLAPIFFAIGMAIFGADHLTSAKFVAQLVPGWIPWHLFWAYFVGCALIAAAVSLAANQHSQLAALLLGAMILLFVPLIHIPSCFATPQDKTRYTIVVRDLALSAGALSSAAAGANPAWKRVVTVARLVIAVSALDFGVQQFLFPDFAPGIPQEGTGVIVNMPAWIPAPTLWAYLTGSILVVCGVALLINWRARAAAIAYGVTALVLAVFVYVPLTVERASDIAGGLNYLAIHFALAGTALFLAGALPKNAQSPAASSET